LARKVPPSPTTNGAVSVVECAGVISPYFFTIIPTS
jgi:hypothetical protein